LIYPWYGKKDRIFLKNKREEKFDRLGLVTQLVVDKKISQYLKPYATRHTWITLQLLSGVHIKNIAKFAGNSPQTIMQNYSSYVPNLSLADEI
jgi:integrase